MNFNIETGVPAVTVFIQGLLSFLSPCVLPLIPIYIGYLSGGNTEDGKLFGSRLRLFINIICFCLGIGAAFFIMGLGASAAGKFFSENRLLFSRIGGVIIILFGIYQTGIFGTLNILGSEKRIPISIEKMKMSPVTAALFGFTFSFAWTPCVGPVLASVLIMAGNSSTWQMGFMLIGVYTAGFIIPFILTGIFTAKILEFFIKYRNVVNYTVKLGGIIMIIMGAVMFSGKFNTSQSATQNTSYNESVSSEDNKSRNEESSEDELNPAPDFILYDQYGEKHRLSDYKGKVVFMNFWATWCSPCKYELPDIQKLYEKHKDSEESPKVEVIGVVAPGFGKEKSEEEIKSFLDENGYTFPVLMDREGTVFGGYGISSMPTTFMINEKGEVFGYVQGALTSEMMDLIIEKTIKNER